MVRGAVGVVLALAAALAGVSALVLPALSTRAVRIRVAAAGAGHAGVATGAHLALVAGLRLTVAVGLALAAELVHTVLVVLGAVLVLVTVGVLRPTTGHRKHRRHNKNAENGPADLRPHNLLLTDTKSRIWYVFQGPILHGLPYLVNPLPGVKDKRVYIARARARPLRTRGPKRSRF